MKIDKNLSWKSHIDYLSIKLSRSNLLFFKIRNLVNRTIYSTIFESNLYKELYIPLYLSHILITTLLYGLRIVMQLIDLLFYKKALRIINFQPRNSHSSPLFKKIFILKSSDNVNLKNTLFVSKSINNVLPSLFNDWFLFSSDQHN